MMGFLAKYESYGYALLRIVTGLLFIWHGTQKLFGFPAPAHEGTPAWITYGAGPIEMIGGLLVMIGLFTRPAAFICSGTMAVAYFVAHAGQALFPSLNQGELAIMFCFSFLFIALRGPGIWALDPERETPAGRHVPGRA